jgi:hypothetical protein
MKLSIIPIDGTVVKDGVSFIKLKFQTCNIPSNINALQWDGHEGWIEDISPLVENQKITELPAWANACLKLWEDMFFIESSKPQETLINYEDFVSLTDEQKLAQIRIERNNRLIATDWTQLSDVQASHDESWINAWKIYRQALRDLPATITDLNDVYYPSVPNA